MRVIAGTARGRPLLAPKGMGTRPMMDIVKGSLFNMLESLGGVEDGIVLDLFAGSGALGIEALSRGAAHADFVEQDREACRIIRANLERLGFAKRGTIHCVKIPMPKSQTPSAAPDWDVRIGKGHRYAVVFMDAPYPAQVSEQLLQQLASWPRLEDNALVCIGHHKRELLPEQVGPLTRIRYRCFGASCLSIYQHSSLHG